jgi:2-C-methyl-D-erythritol 2,4-cyclodiphosphate synthase
MSEQGQGLKVAFGYDSHRLAPSRKLVLGGVIIPYAAGLVGHSDADVVCHAVTDALLSSAGFGDIGKVFPETDPALRGANSLKLLSEAAEMARKNGYEAINCDCTIIAEAPKIAPYTGEMAENVATALGVPKGMVTVKGKTNEGMDSSGRGEGIQVYVVMLISCR